MNNATNPLFAVLSHSEEARDEALGEFEKARQNVESAKAQLQSLHDFRQQYQVRWQEQFSRSGGVEIMRCYNEFMARMTEAETEQQRRVEHVKTVQERCRLELVERERRVAAVSLLMQKREQEHQRKENRRDQKATDELAARLGSGNNQGMSSLSGLSSATGPAM